MLSVAARAGGYLKIGSIACGVEQIAAISGSVPSEAQKLVDELEKNGVFSRARDGTIYNRRMVRDEKRRETNRKNGKIGGAVSVRKQRENFRSPKRLSSDTPSDTPSPLNPIPLTQEDSVSSLSSETGADVADVVSLFPSPPATFASADPPGKEPVIVAQVFDLGVRILTRRGTPERNARAMIGKFRKSLHDDGRLLGILFSVDRENPVDPIAYLTKAVQRASDDYVAGFASPGFS